MDISVRVFLSPEEFITLLEVASDCGGSILYRPTPDTAYRRVESGSPLPDELQTLLRTPRTVDSRHRLFVTTGNMGADPEAVPANRLILAYFGGFDERALYISPLSVRSNDEHTLKLMRCVAKWVKAHSTTGIEAWGEPVEEGDKGVVDRGARYSPGAADLVRSGLQLRQRGVANVHFRIAELAGG